MRLDVRGPVIEWRGPAPHHFVALSQRDSDDLRAMVTALSYGWGAIPVQAVIGATAFTTSLMPRDGRYLLPIKDAVRRAEGLDLGSAVVAVIDIEGRSAGP